MGDLDFDELDKAVKAVMSDSGISDDSISSPVTINSPKSNSASPIHKGPLVGGSKESFRPKKRNRLFMDVKSSANNDSSTTDLLMGSAEEPEHSTRPMPKKDFNTRNFEFTNATPSKSEPKPAVEEKAPFADAFASLQEEVKALGFESDVINVNHRGPSVEPIEAKTEPEQPKEEEAEVNTTDEDASYSPFLSSVSIDKRPLGGYGNDTAHHSDSNEAASEQSDDLNSEESESKSAQDFYGVDPLADMTVEDIDAAIVNPEGGSSTSEETPSPESSPQDTTIGELGSRIERELNGETSDDLTNDGEKIELVNPEAEGEETTLPHHEDSFHMEAPIYQDNEVQEDFDAKFAAQEVDGYEDEPTPAAIPTPAPLSVPAKQVVISGKDDSEQAPVQEDEKTEVEEVSEEEPDEPEALSQEKMLGKMTVSPGDDSVSVEQVAAMEESFAAQTEGPQEQTTKKKGLIRKVKLISDKPVKEDAKSEDKPSILREGGPSSITPQYRTSVNPLKTDKTEHSSFNPDSFSMPVGNVVKSNKGLSPLVLVIVSVLAVVIGVAAAFGLFYSGLIQFQGDP